MLVLSRRPGEKIRIGGVVLTYLGREGGDVRPRARVALSDRPGDIDLPFRQDVEVLPGVSVTFTSFAKGTARARLGITAPRGIEIVRTELEAAK